jgi:hypothetical protein
MFRFVLLAATVVICSASSIANATCNSAEGRPPRHIEADGSLTCEPVIGMDGQDTMATWGWPEGVNTDETSSGIREQWVYPGRGYLYFENGRLVAIQRRN